MSDRFVLCQDYCGLVDGTGARVTDRVFEHLDDFKGPIAIYSRHGKYGDIDRSGQRIIKPTHDAMWSPVNGFVVAEDGSPRASDGSDGSTTYTFFDERGAELLRLQGHFIVGGWGGQPYYYQPQCTADSRCPTIFIDGQGKPLARFASFSGRPGEALAVASVDGTHYGYVDHTLHFTIPPRYTAAQAFQRDVAVVSTPAGPALIDRAGREVIKPGRYAKLYAWPLTPLITAFRADQPECPVYVRPDGRELRTPPGICEDDAEYVDALGYAFVRDAERRRGIIDADGHLLIRPTYPWLRAVSDRYLAFGDKMQPTRFGLVDRRGNVILPLSAIRIEPYTAGCCAGPKALRDALIGVMPDGGTGLLGLDGKWLVPARYKEVRELSADLLAMRDADDRYHVFTVKGQPLALLSDSAPSSWRSDGRVVAISFSRRDGAPGRQRLLKGLADPAGATLIPADYLDLADAGDGLIALTTPGSPQKIGFADMTGRMVAEPQFADLLARFRDGAAVMRDAKGDVVLLNEDGKAITRFAEAFPELANRGGGFDQVDQALDICIDPDPAAEPEEKPSQQPAARKICGDPALRQLSRDTEKAWRSAQAGDCLPDVLIALRPPYDRAIANCNDGGCVANAMRAFVDKIADRTRQCAVPERTGASKRPIAASVRASLTKRLVAAAAERDDQIADNDGRVSIDLRPFALGRRQAILAVAAASAHNGPVWVFLRDRRGGWKEVFYGYAGYLRPLEASSEIRNGLPILRTQQHVSCCEHAVAYHAYDGNAYKLVRTCTQRYDADETPLLFCDDEPDATERHEQ